MNVKKFFVFFVTENKFFYVMKTHYIMY